MFQLVSLEVSLEFMVEIDKRKQEYLRTRFPSARWVFDDMKEMGKKSAKTWDGSEQTIPEAGHSKPQNTYLKPNDCPKEKFPRVDGLNIFGSSVILIVFGMLLFGPTLLRAATFSGRLHRPRWISLWQVFPASAFPRLQ